MKPATTKPALTPKLRFPKFRNTPAWDAKPGDDLFDQINNRGAPAGLAILAITQEHGAIPRDEIDYHVSVTDKSVETYKEVCPGDFIISLRSFQGGIEYSRYHGICSPAYVILRKKGELSDAFFKQLFKSYGFIQQLTKNLEGLRDGKMISYKQFSELLLPWPEPAEQQKIAECLSTLDELIGAESQKLDALKAHKKGLMQQLFPHEGETLPRLRFPEFQNDGDWVKKPFSELCDVKHGYAFESEFFSDEGDYVLLTPGNFNEEGGYRDRAEKQKFYTGEIPRDYVLQKGDILVAMTEQAAGLLGSPLIVPASERFLHNQRLGLLVPKPGAAWTNDFFFHVFNSQPVRKAIDASASGAKVRHTSPTKIGEVVVSVPTLPAEQHHIATCLSSLDDLIAAQSDRLAALQTHKQGLLQQLFPSTADAAP
jgi:type I restriction enzyme S subunit